MGHVSAQVSKRGKQKQLKNLRQQNLSFISNMILFLVAEVATDSSLLHISIKQIILFIKSNKSLFSLQKVTPRRRISV